MVEDHEAFLAKVSGGVAPWLVPVFVAVALAAGLATSAIGEARRINLHTAPILLLIGWNAFVYLAMIVGRMTRRGRVAPARTLIAWIAGWPVRRLAGRAAAGEGMRIAITRWLDAHHDVLLARTAVALHLAAAFFMMGAIGGMYLRGVGFEYLAGWESTFLDARAVQRVLSAALLPGELLTGLAVGDAAHIESIRFHDGAGGGPATSWIHLFAISGAAWVIVPRLALAALAGARTTGLARATTTRHDVTVTAHGVRLDAPTRARAEAALVGALGLTVRVTFAGDTPRPQAAQALLFALATTPEDEVHGALLREAGPRAVLVDERSFAERFGDDAAVMDRRRNAWTTFLGRFGQVPLFLPAGP